MVCTTSRSKPSQFHKLLFALISTIPCLILSGCAEPKPALVQPIFESGLDESGRPLAYQPLPKTKFGEVDWVASLNEGILSPKPSLDSDQEPTGSVLDLDIVFNVSRAYPVPNVVFPHAPHTMWLNCRTCHPDIFIMKQGANPVSMDRIIKGEFCGRCHGVVAFPVTDCFRCHSREKNPLTVP